MHRIDDPTAVPTLPAPRPAGTPGYFTGGSPGTGGFLATVVRYEFMNALQEELAAIVAAASITLDKTNNNQVLAALRAMLRFKLAQDTTFYVSPTGNDSNDGLTAATPLRTGQAAWNKALTIDLNNHNLTLKFANGTYTDPLYCTGAPLGANPNGVTILGNVAQPNQVIFAPASGVSCITANNGGVAFVEGVSLTAHGVPASYQNMGGGLVVGSAGYIAFSNVIFQQCDWSHIVALGSGIVSSNGNPYSIAGGGGCHMLATLGGEVTNANSAVAITGTPAFATSFANADAHGMVITYGAAYSGAATGVRFVVGNGGLIHTNGGGPNFLPGNAAGITSAATYGVYI
jgi:hypothetical protein